MPTSNKILVIGWDSATFDVLNPLLEAGAMPNLQSTLERGAAATLMSTIQPLTPTAWSSFATGVNPGKHGIFDFVRLESGGEFQLNSGAHLGSPTLWRWLSHGGKRVTVINVPMTYPPEPVNGQLIAGMDSPDQNRAYTYPPELAARIMRQFPDYKVGVRASNRRASSVEAFTEQYVAELIAMTHMRADLACHTLRQEQPDFFMVVFIAPDRVQHALGSQMQPTVSPGSGIGRVYAACDEALGRILDEIDETWTLFLVSDHGGCAYQRVFELSTWLVHNGWLQLRAKRRISQAREYAGKVQRTIARKLDLAVTQRPGLQQFKDRVVWPETYAFSLGAFGNIYINRKARFPWGIVGEEEVDAICEQIVERLLAIRDRETGQPVIEAVHRARDIYSGPYVGLAPDLLIETHRDYFVRNNLDQEEGRIIYPAGQYRGRQLAHTGRHTSDGILVVAGPAIQPRKDLGSANIIDIAPTVMYLSDLPIPAEMDGRPLVELLSESYTNQHPLTYDNDTPAASDGRSGESYSEEEMAEMSERLRALGYID